MYDFARAINPKGASNYEQKYECTGSVNFEGRQKTAQTYENYPSYSVEVSQNGNTKFSAERKLPKASGFDEATAVRRSKLSVEDDIKNNLRNLLSNAKK